MIEHINETKQDGINRRCRKLGDGLQNDAAVFVLSHGRLHQATPTVFPRIACTSTCERMQMYVQLILKYNVESNADECMHMHASTGKCEQVHASSACLIAE